MDKDLTKEFSDLEKQFEIIEENLELYNKNISAVTNEHIDIIQALVVTLCNSMVKIDPTVNGKFIDRMENVHEKITNIINTIKEKKQEIQVKLEENTDKKLAINAYEKMSRK